MQTFSVQKTVLKLLARNVQSKFLLDSMIPFCQILCMQLAHFSVYLAVIIFRSILTEQKAS